jgi:quercetin dioxygenase-like cupin family protein
LPSARALGNAGTHETKDRRMSQAQHFHNLADVTQGIARELAPGVTTRIFPGEQAMLSVVTIAPNGEGTLHAHPEEQWGVLLEGSAVRIQGGEEIAVKKGDFWRTPGGIPHTMRAGPEGCQVLDIFSPPREAYRVAGSGFGTG